ncbi:MAG: S24 family peptidase [Pseudomonadota bacterium]|nr:S24 family peptidase [Pseudomonadota bacterium]
MANDELLARIDQRLRDRGLTDYRASMLAAGRPEIIRNIRRGRSNNPRRDTLEKLARVLDCSFEWLATGRGPVEPLPDGNGLAGSIPAVAGAAPLVPARAEMALDVPVLGTAAGSLDGAFQLDIGAPIDRVRRPPGIATAVDIYALYVVGDSMSPRFEDGELIYVSGRRPVRPGDYVVVQVKTDDDRIEAFCKKLRRRDQDRLTLQQFNPETAFDVPVARVTAVHKVLSLNDLFGL